MERISSHRENSTGSGWAGGSARKNWPADHMIVPSLTKVHDSTATVSGADLVETNCWRSSRSMITVPSGWVAPQGDHTQSSVVRLSFEAFVKHSSNSGIQSSCRSNVRAQAESGIRWTVTPGKRAGRVLVQTLQCSCPRTELGSDHTKPTIVQKRRHFWIGCGPFLPVNLFIAPLSSLNLRCIVCSNRQRCDRIWRAVRCWIFVSIEV